MKKIHIYILALSCLLFFQCKSTTSEVSINTSQIDSLFNDAVANKHIPGAVAFVKKGDKIVYHKAFGFQNIEKMDTMKTSSVFRLASMTKALTAVAILQLKEQNKLQLDDLLSNYLPAFKNPKVLTSVKEDSTFIATNATSEITIRQLLTHTSGLGYGFQNENYNALIIKNKISEGFCPDNRTSMDNTLKIAAIPLLANPGEKNIYGLSYEVLGTLIEELTNERYDRYVQKNILDPIGMKDSYFYIPKPQQHRLVSVYEPDSIGLKPTTYNDVHYPVLESRNFFAGGSDLSSTAEDYHKFLEMIKNGGTYKGNTILSKESVDEMLSPQTPFNDGDSTQGFAAWVVNEKGAKTGVRNLGSYDFGGFFDTYSWVDPKVDLQAVLLLQMYPNNNHDIHWKFQKAVYKSISNP